MKKHKDFLYTLLGIGFMASLIFIVYKSKQPEPIQLDLSEKPKTEEHDLIGEILSDTESFTVKEDAAIESEVTQQLEVESVTAPSIEPVDRVSTGSWERQAAPNIADIRLSPSLERSLEASASLRTENFSNPSSEFNSGVVGSLREIRRKRTLQSNELFDSKPGN